MIKVTSLEPMRHTDSKHGGNILACVDVMDTDHGIFISDMLLTYDGVKPRVRPAKRKGKRSQFFFADSSPYSTRIARAAFAHYSSFSAEHLAELRQLFGRNAYTDDRGTLIEK
jgi:hypothetical protein